MGSLSCELTTTTYVNLLLCSKLRMDLPRSPPPPYSPSPPNSPPPPYRPPLPPRSSAVQQAAPDPALSPPLQERPKNIDREVVASEPSTVHQVTMCWLCPLLHGIRSQFAIFSSALLAFFPVSVKRFSCGKIQALSIAHATSPERTGTCAWICVSSNCASPFSGSKKQHGVCVKW